MDQQVPEHVAGNSSSDTGSYQTADDEDDSLTVREPDLQHPVDDTDEQQDISEFESSSSSEEDDSRISKNVTVDHKRLPVRRTEPEKRRNSYQFAISKSGVLTPDPNDDLVDYDDLDPVEFHHQHQDVQKSDISDDNSESHSEEFFDLDPKEFMHRDLMQQPTQLTNVVQDITSTEYGVRRSDEQKQSDSEVFEDDGHEEPLAALGLLSRGHSVVTERREIVVKGNALPTIKIPSPTWKTLVTDRREWIVRQSVKRAVFSVAPEQLPLLTAVGNVVKPTNHLLSTSILYKVSPEDDKQVPTRLSDINKELLPVVEAVVHETTELIRAKLVEPAALWEPFMYDEMALSSSPEKENSYSFEERVPSPDYDLSASSSDTGSEAGADVAVEDDIHPDMLPCRIDRSPTPDYNLLSPIFEDKEFHFDTNEHSKQESSAEVQTGFADGRHDEIEVDDLDKFECSGSQPLLLARKERFAKPVDHSASTLEPALAEQTDEDDNMECEREDADVSSSFEQTQSAELTQPSKDSYNAGEKGMLWQSQSKTRISSADQRTLYATLGSSSEKRRRTAKRSVVIQCCTVL